jgi:dolichol-phosphate mannosyltransferase
VSIVVPVYYNAESIAPLYAELLEVERQLAERDLALQLIFVNDGSGDNSLEELLKLKQAYPEKITVVNLTRNFGAIHASKTGFQFVQGDCFGILAADLQDPPTLIVQMADYWLQGHKFVICVREKREDTFLTRLYARLYYILLRLIVIRDYPDGGYDMALMDRAMLPYLLNSSKNINTPLFAYWLGFKPVTIHYVRRERKYGRSRWTFMKKLKFMLDSLLGFSIVPIRAISLTGLFVSILSFCYGSVVAFNALRGIRDVSGFPTLVWLITFLLGLVIIMLGIIGEYLWRIFDEINKRPESVIDEIY